MGSTEASTTAAGSGYTAGTSNSLATSNGAARSYAGSTTQENYGASTGYHYEERCYTQQQ
ncbi:hypothetical protein DWU98_12560 [Dyella monticola]|uniref:Uncharacterized protein n=2 Tax=Dyella monticola TaxID=1927958 RepID=A0A370WXA8_9GAMM|nr:hypothetical protein DWU98_12560 [Dyella monticola]